jgi:hypothetical protein
VRQALYRLSRTKGFNSMAASITVKLDEDGSVKDLCEGEAKKHFDLKGDDDKGELTMKDDPCVTIKYQVKDNTCTFTVTKSPRLFKDADLNKMLQTLFG